MIDPEAVTLATFGTILVLALSSAAVTENCRAQAAPMSLPDEVRAGTCPPSPPSEFERSVIEAADAGCVNRRGVRQAEPGRLDVIEALAWLREEHAAGLGAEYAGITLASWCRETSYRTGDFCARPGSCDEGQADGPLQMWPIFSRLCWGGVDRRAELRAAVACYLSRIVLRLDEVERRCGVRDVLTAQAWVASAPRYWPRCGAVSQHGEIHRRWRR